MFQILTAALIVLFVRNHFDLKGVEKDVRGIAKTAGKIVRGLAAMIRNAVKETKKEAAKVRKTLPGKETRMNAASAEEPAQAEEQENGELLKELELNTRTAAMLANVPTLEFPKDDPKYDSSLRKCRYA